MIHRTLRSKQNPHMYISETALQKFKQQFLFEELILISSRDYAGLENNLRCDFHRFNKSSNEHSEKIINPIHHRDFVNFRTRQHSTDSNLIARGVLREIRTPLTESKYK